MKLNNCLRNGSIVAAGGDDSGGDAVQHLEESSSTAESTKEQSHNISLYKSVQTSVLQGQGKRCSFCISRAQCRGTDKPHSQSVVMGRTNVTIYLSSVQHSNKSARCVVKKAISLRYAAASRVVRQQTVFIAFTVRIIIIIVRPTGIAR